MSAATDNQLPDGLYCVHFLGDAKPLGRKYLPTILEMLQCYQLTSHEMAIYTGKKTASAQQISSMVASRVMFVWRLAGIPTLGKTKVAQMVSEWFTSYGEACKLLKRAHKARAEFQKKLAALLNIADQKKCDEMLDEKVKNFLQDQRKDRSMYLVFEGNTVTYSGEDDEEDDEECGDENTEEYYANMSTDSNGDYRCPCGMGHINWSPRSGRVYGRNW